MVTEAAPKRETDPKKRVVITGMGLCSVFGNDVNTFYDNLLEGNSGIKLIDRFDASQFPTKFAGQIKNFSAEGYIDAKNDRRMDNCLRYAMVSGKKALKQAGLEKGQGLDQVREAGGWRAGELGAGGWGLEAEAGKWDMGGWSLCDRA